ncbi:MAG TPA: STAS domain-containing protein [Nitrospira sp.]|nr:STAS domain-containing protein [Nitrospira sp.]
MNVTSELVGNIHVIIVNGDLDVSNVHEFKNFVVPMLSSPIKIVVDLSNVPFIDSSGMGAMIACWRMAVAVGGKVKICCLSKQVRESLELIRLDHIFDIYMNRSDALDAMSDSHQK